MEYVNPLTGFRLDGRRPNEMRQIRGEIGVVSKADGSASFEMGNTKVIAAVYGPREVQNRSQQINNQALVRCEYSMANFSTGDRTRRPKGDRRSMEISLVIRQSLEACIMTHLMPRSQIDIFVQVLQADGGTRSACINAATLALADAGIPMRDLVTSCSAGYLCTTPLLDLNYVEDSAGGPDVTVGILAKMDKVTLLQMDAKLPMDIFENVMQLAIEGCKAIAQYIREKKKKICLPKFVVHFCFKQWLTWIQPSPLCWSLPDFYPSMLKNYFHHPSLIFPLLTSLFYVPLWLPGSLRAYKTTGVS